MKNKCTIWLILSGAVITVLAVMFGRSKEGKELAKKMKDDIEKAMNYMKKNLDKLHDASKDEFDELVTTLVDEYAKKKDMSDDAKKKIIKALKSKWKETKEAYDKKLSLDK